MRVLLVSHLLPPAHTGGTELYTLELARRLRAAGVAVELLASEKDVGRPDLSLHERRLEGLVVHELVNNLYYRDFRQTWSQAEIESRFAQLLERNRPDLVHFQHLMYLSAGCLAVAKRKGLPVLLTLHDFWLECARFGQLVHVDGSLCERVDHERCGGCLARLKWRQTTLERRTGRALAAWRSLSGLDWAPAARRLAERLGSGGHKGAPAPVEAATAARFSAAARERSRVLLELARTHVDRFLSPSRFLLERARAFGLPAERLIHLPTGIDERFRGRREPRRGERLRLRFFGTLVPLKGAHVLLEAWGRVDPALRARGELVLYGTRSHEPLYQRRLDELARECGARLGGLLEREGVARELGATDLCIVPSTWFENRPLIVLEALASGTPLLVSDTGALGELVQEGRGGWTFPRGDAAALARRLSAVLADPSSLERLDPSAVEVPTWEQTASATLALYRELCGEPVP